MNIKVIVFIVFLSATTSEFISMNSAQTHSGPHGGRLQQSENFNIETKTFHSEFYAYLLNAQCKPINNNGISCEIRFFFSDSSNLDVTLKPYHEDGFRIESSVSGYQYYRVIFNAFGKIISAKFENENAIVKKNNLSK